jgi:hypothetical protein
MVGAALKAVKVKCYMLRSDPEKTREQRRIQIALNAGNWKDRLPKVPESWKDDERITFLLAVKDVVGPGAFLDLGPKGITKYGDALGFPAKQRKVKLGGDGEFYRRPKPIADLP